MASTIAELAAIIKIDASDAQKAIDGLIKSFSGVGSAFDALSKVATGSMAVWAGVATAIGIVGKAAFDAAVEFDDASDHIRIATGAMGDDLKGLETSFKNVFTSVPTSAAAASEAIAFLAGRLHITGDALESLTKQELELSRMTGEALKPQLEATTRVFKDWEVATGQQSQALDFLFKVSQQTQIGVTQLSQELVKFGAPLREMGFSFEQAATLIGKFQAEGVELNKALPGLRIALTKMAKEGISDASEGFERLIQKIKDMKNPMDAITEATKLFGSKAAVDMVEAIKQGRFNIEELQKTIEGSRETILGAAKDTEDFAEKWAILKNKVETALEPLGGIIFDTLSAIVSTFIDKGDEINKRWNKVWDDLHKDTQIGLDQMLLDIVDANNPFFNAGADLGEAFKRGVKSAIHNLGTWMAGEAAEAAEKANQEAMKASTEISRAYDEEATTLRKMTRENQAAIDATQKHTAAARNGAGAHKALSSAVEVSAEKMAAFKRAVDEANSAANASKFFSGEALRGVTEAFDDLDGHLVTEVNLLPTFSAAIETATQGIIDHGKALESAARFAGPWVQALDLMKAKQEASKITIENLNKEFEDLSRSLPRSWNIIVDSFTKGSIQLGIKVKGFAADLLGVFDALPGKWGDSFRKTISEMDKWVNFIDSAIKVIQRILGDQSPTGLGGILSKVGGIFKKTTQDIQQSTDVLTHTEDDWATAQSQTMAKAATGTEQGASRIVGAFTQIAGAALAFVGAKGAGFAGGALSGALGGIAAAGGIATALGVALSPLTLGLSALGGALLGGILGLFKGKSAEQKAAEARQLEQAKLNLQQTAQNVINAAIEGFDKALQFFEHLDEFTQVRKAKFQAFFANLTRLMNNFVELSKAWSTESLAQAKAFAESVGPIADAVGGAVQALTALFDFKEVPAGNIDTFGKNLQQLIQRMGEVFDSLAKDIIKHGRKLAENLESITSVLSPLLEGFANLLKFQPVDETVLDSFFDGLKMFVAKMGAIADTMDLGEVKFTARFAESVTTILGVIKSGVEALSSLADFKGVAPEAFQALLDGFKQAVAILTDMLDQATEFESIAMQIEDKLVSAADHLKKGAAAMAAGITSATSTTGSATGGGTVGAASLAGGGASAGATVVQYIVQGSLIRESELANLHMTYNEANRRRGRLLTVTA